MVNLKKHYVMSPSGSRLPAKSPRGPSAGKGNAEELPKAAQRDRKDGDK
jgi:hypothetical protein